jgi:hypothetical protein
MSKMPDQSRIYFSSIADSLSVWLPGEYERKWSAVLSDNILHANSRCEEVGGEDSWNLKNGDKLTSITLDEMIKAPNHCLACIRSYLEGGFIYNWFGNCYKSVININNAFLVNDNFEMISEFYSFSYSDIIGVAEETLIYDKLKVLGILSPNYSRPLSYLYIKKKEIPNKYPIDRSGDHSFKNGFYLHPLFSKEIIPYGIELPTPVNELCKVLEVFTVLLNDSNTKYGYDGVKDLWNISDKI